MAESGWFAAGAVLGLIVGIVIGFIIAGAVARPQGSVVLERDEKGRIVGIHYLPAKPA